MTRNVRPDADAGGRDGCDSYWSLAAADAVRRLGTSPTGLTTDEAARRLAQQGPNELRERRRLTALQVVQNQLRSPLVLLLVVASAISGLTGQWVDAAIVLPIVAASVWVGASREYGAERAAEELRARVRTRATVLRDGRPTSIPMREVVPGDVAMLSPGGLVPGDGVLLDAADFFVTEAVLTGESFPVEKRPGAVPAATPVAGRTGCVFLGTTARSGAARVLVVRTGPATEFGAIAHRLTLRAPETEFDRGLRRFGYMLTSLMLVLVLLVFAGNMLLGRPPIETLLFSVALAVGLSPELLPAVLNVNLARAAQAMARRGVLVRRLAAIENLGSMDVLCTDKTGTLTEGVVRLEGAWGPDGEPSEDVLHSAAVNAALQTGPANPLDEAILGARTPPPGRHEKLGEIPYDFVRKRLSVVVRDGPGARLVAKGAFEPTLAACTRAAGAPLDSATRAALENRFREWSARGVRVLAVATRAMAATGPYRREDESDLEFVGFLTFLDRAKPGVADAIADLGRLGVSIKVITGDAELVARHVAATVGLRAERVLTGRDLDELRDEALWRTAEDTDVFAEVDPNQKERVIQALRKTGHVVGFLGDGVNDAPAMHASDTSLSVESAADVAREAADFVLLERDIDVIRGGIEEGRRTFANTLKYVLTTTSANLGNMISMAVASLFLPFLPLLAGQILLNNLLSDVPALGLADDRVDEELVARPRRWNLRFIGRFMVEFGTLSSLFDLVTFGALLGLFAAGPALFRTGWFVESLLTELAVAFVVRTRRPAWRSRPGTFLLRSSVALAAIAFAVPFLPHADVLGFVPTPIPLLLTLAGITALYVLTAEALKSRFYRDPARAKA